MALQESFAWVRTLASDVREFLPQMLGAFALLAGGWLVGHVLRRWTRALCRKLVSRLAANAWFKSSLEGTRLGQALPEVVGAFAFWLVFIFFLGAAVEVIGLPLVTTTLTRFAYYLPNVLGAVLLVLVGLLIGNLVRHWVSRASQSAGVAYGGALGRVAQIAVLMISVVIAIEELGIEGELLVLLVAIGVGSMLAGASLAFGLGARTAVSNLIARHYLTQAYSVGQTVRIGDVQGRIISTTPTGVILAGSTGQVHVPAQRFTDEVSVLLAND